MKRDKSKVPSFQIDIANFKKQAGSESDISHTIEELLELNKMIPSRWGEPASETQEGQLDKTQNRWEEDKITQRQLQEAKDTDIPTHWGGDPDVKKMKGEQEGSLKKKEMVGHELEDHKDELGIIEKRFDNKKINPSNRNEDAWNTGDDPLIRGHKDVPPIWKEVYDKEDESKALDKDQMRKKKKPQKNV